MVLVSESMMALVWESKLLAFLLAYLLVLLLALLLVLLLWEVRWAPSLAQPFFGA
jgi:hypothetical protein